MSWIREVIDNYVDSQNDDKIVCPLPNHNESTPSFNIYDDQDKYHCFGCGKGGDSIDFVGLMENLKFPKAKEKVLSLLNVSEKEYMESKPVSEAVIEAVVPEMSREQIVDLIRSTGYVAHEYRGIKDEHNKFFGHLTKLSDTGEVLARYYPETNSEGKISGYKCRNHPKDFSHGKTGVTGNKSQLSGQVKFTSRGKYLLIVGGEEDKVAAYQMLFENRSDTSYDSIAVVSPTSGESSCAKQVAAQFTFCDQFDQIHIGLDNDEAGRAAAEAVAAVLPKEKVRMVLWSGKDPNKMLQDGKAKQFCRDFYAGKPLVNSGIKESSGLMSSVREELMRPRIGLPKHWKKVEDATRGGFLQGRIYNIIGDTSVGKCHGKDTPVIMFDGSVKMVQDVVQGDKIMGADGSVRNVLSTVVGKDTMYRIDQVDGESYVVNSHHILSLRAGFDCKDSGVLKGDIVNVKVIDYLQYGSKLKRSLKGYKANLSKLGEGSSPVFEPYIMGLWLADGTSAKPSITVNNSDIEVGAEVDAFIRRNGYTRNVSPSNVRSGCYTVDCVGGFRTELTDLGMINDKHIPQEYLLAGESDRLELLSGLLDGDGYLHNGVYEIIQKSEKLASDIVFLARSLGFRVKVTDKFSKCQGFEGAIYKRILISGEVSKLNMRTPRKVVGELSDLRKLKNTTITVTEIGGGDYYGFCLDGDHLYCLGDFTVTHNTTHINDLVYYWMFNASEKVGVVSLENTDGQYTIDLLSLHLEKNLMWLGEGQKILDYLDDPKVMALYENLLTNEQGQPRFSILDERDGDIKMLEKQIEKLINQYGCRIIVVDVLTDILRGSNAEHQEDHMKWQKQIVKSGVTIFNVLHTRKPQNSEGGWRKATEYDALGSGTFVQSSAGNIVVSRDKMNPDPIIKNTTHVDIPKMRGGDTGEICQLVYDANKRKTIEYEEFMRSQGQGGGGQQQAYREPSYDPEYPADRFENIPDPQF